MVFVTEWKINKFVCFGVKSYVFMQRAKSVGWRAAGSVVLRVGFF